MAVCARSLDVPQTRFDGADVRGGIIINLKVVRKCPIYSQNKRQAGFVTHMPCQMPCDSSDGRTGRVLLRLRVMRFDFCVITHIPSRFGGGGVGITHMLGFGIALTD